ncbi:N-acetylmuramoyl-L-alanine amidase [Christiangramia fulva]|uniref:N-acetylmuramoyl-L-alanine amidase n=1 Tax=Christiangramia fulva TaxID=2126553 RepID=A0A2R3Z1E4_9FLAO|nr:peptidoglycan recognition family protein [Christiangramia fulva]AVR44080.1 N-acetylmuramoyl-L-alanine amidase [Christiangramia fulva]
MFRAGIQILTILGFISIVSCKSRIIDKPIHFDNQRKELTREYIKDHYGLEVENIKIDPKIIVLHWTAIPTLQGSFNAFNYDTLPAARKDIAKASRLNVSIQFLVDRDGTIYRLMPEDFMARHVIGLNYNAIGIENVGGTPETPLTNDQLKANIWLVNYLNRKYNIEYLIGHYEYTKFEGSDLWKELNDNYRTEKTDPGEEFMRKVREAVKDQNLKSAPAKN